MSSNLANLWRRGNPINHSRSMHLAFVAAVTSGGMVGCADASKETTTASSSYVGRSSAGDTTILTSLRPVFPGGGELVENLSIGMIDGPDEYVFGRGTIAAVDEAGNIFISDGSVPTIREFDRNGTYVRSIGRGGDGPGEYRGPVVMTVHPDGRIFVYDRPQRRLLVYSRTGEALETRAVELSASSAVAAPEIVADTAGNVYVKVPARDPRSSPYTLSSLPGWLMFDSSGEILDTLHVVGMPDLPLYTVAATSRDPEGRTVTRYADIPYYPINLAALSPLGYLVTANSSRYALDLRITPSKSAHAEVEPSSIAAPRRWMTGDPVVSIRLDQPQVEIPTREREDRMHDIEASLRVAVPGWIWSGPEIPTAKPHMTAILTGLDGRIWVAASLPSEEREIGPDSATGPDAFNSLRRWHEPVAYDVFETSGEYLGRIRIADKTRINRMRGDTVWATQYDEDNLPFFKRFVVRWKN